MSANVIDCHLSNIIACNISKNKYSEHAETATVRPIFKKDDRSKINSRPAGLLNIFSRIYEIFFPQNLKNYVNSFFQNSFLFTASHIAPTMF